MLPAHIENLKHNFYHVFGLPLPAIEWLVMLWQATQTFDDLTDKDPVDQEDLNALIWNTLVAMNQNTFWLTHCQSLTPVVATMILKWQAANSVESEKNADARSFTWRAGYYDVVLMVVSLSRGAEFATKVAHLVMGMYGEKLEDYLKEINHA